MKNQFVELTEDDYKRKAYLDTVEDSENIENGDIDLLPESIRKSYGKFETAWIEAMSMRSSGLCHPDDIQDQVDVMNGHYREFRRQLREFLGLEEDVKSSCAGVECSRMDQ